MLSSSKTGGMHVLQSFRWKVTSKRGPVGNPENGNGKRFPSLWYCLAAILKREPTPTRLVGFLTVCPLPGTIARLGQSPASRYSISWLDAALLSKSIPRFQCTRLVRVIPTTVAQFADCSSHNDQVLLLPIAKLPPVNLQFLIVQPVVSAVTIPISTSHQITVLCYAGAFLCLD